MTTKRHRRQFSSVDACNEVASGDPLIQIFRVLLGQTSINLGNAVCLALGWLNGPYAARALAPGDHHAVALEVRL